MNFIYNMIAAFSASFCFSVMFNVPKRELIFCSMAGSCGWVMFLFVREMYNSPVIATFFAVIVIAAVCRLLAYRRKMPITVFLIPVIIPLVPGAGIYNTMYNIVINDLVVAARTGVEALKIASVIAIAIIIVLSLPARFFYGEPIKFGKKRKTDTKHKG